MTIIPLISILLIFLAPIANIHSTAAAPILLLLLRRGGAKPVSRGEGRASRAPGRSGGGGHSRATPPRGGPCCRAPHKLLNYPIQNANMRFTNLLNLNEKIK